MGDPLAEAVIDPVAGQARGRSLPRALTPFRTPAYRRLAVALVLSTFAGGVWIVALVWEVIRIGGGPAQLSVVSTSAAVGVLVSALLAGVVADRIPQKQILLGVAAVEGVGMGLVALLSVLDLTRLWHLAAVATVIGMAMAFYYAAYSAWLPALVPESDLMAVNGFEGMVRPTIGQAVGPGVAGLVVGAASSGAALGVAAVAALASMVCLTTVPLTPVRRDTSVLAGRHPVCSAFGDMREGFVYMVRTPWLLATLLFASLMILAMMGPLEVLVPFLVKDKLGGGPGDHALVLAAFGVGGAIGSLAMASITMPRRYLTAMNLGWGLGALPLAAFGLATSVWQVVLAGLVLGAAFSAPMVIWGTPAAPGAAGTARPGGLAGLLRVREPDAGVDGPGRAGGRRDRVAQHLLDRRPRARGGGDRGGAVGPAAGGRDRPPAALGRLRVVGERPMRRSGGARAGPSRGCVSASSPSSSPSTRLWPGRARCGRIHRTNQPAAAASVTTCSSKQVIADADRSGSWRSSRHGRIRPASAHLRGRELRVPLQHGRLLHTESLGRCPASGGVIVQN